MTYELSAIDRRFADFICRQSGDTSRTLYLVVSLVSSAVGRGHICVHLPSLAGSRIVVDGAEGLFPPLEELRRILEGTCAVGSEGAFTPLIMDNNNRIYLYRYWRYERDLAEVITAKGATTCQVDEPLLADGLARYFPVGNGQGTDWQKVAAAAALRKQFCVISGGPGTGKTSTVVKIIALLAEQNRDAPLRIALAAPTGKAAARLKESIASMKKKLECTEEIREMIPDGVSTIHRLLGARGTSVRFKHSAENLLPWDVVIVDEASMVALPLMAKLVVALRPDARLILLGDRDQLASVEAGAVLGDICGRGRSEYFSPEFAAYLARVTGQKIPTAMPEDSPAPVSERPAPSAQSPEPVSRSLASRAQSPEPVFSLLTDSLIVLRKNYRCTAGSIIGDAARATNAGEGVSALELLRERGGWRDAPTAAELKQALSERIVDGYASYLRSETVEEALRKFDGFRVLCALHRGAYGVTAVNCLIEEILDSEGLIQRHNRWYHGRPVMVTVNDYNLKLFNGDVGIVWTDDDGEMRVCFPTTGGGVRMVSPVRLPAHETVFAMTVHKSQGSEFEVVLLLLPAHDAAPLSRELIYTGLTRGRSAAEIWGDETVFLDAVRRRTERDSGLEDLLWPMKVIN